MKWTLLVSVINTNAHVVWKIVWCYSICNYSITRPNNLQSGRAGDRIYICLTGVHTCTALACSPQMMVLVSFVNKGAFVPLTALRHCSGEGFSSGVFSAFSDMYTVCLPPLAEPYKQQTKITNWLNDWAVTFTMPIQTYYSYSIFYIVWLVQLQKKMCYFCCRCWFSAHF